MGEKKMTPAAVSALAVQRISFAAGPRSGGERGSTRKASTVARMPTHCSSCNLREVCLP